MEYKVKVNLSEKEVNELAKDGWILKFVNTLPIGKRTDSMLTRECPAHQTYRCDLQYIFERE